MTNDENMKERRMEDQDVEVKHEPGFSLSIARKEHAITQNLERSIIDQLSALENGAALFEARANLLAQCHRAALSRTSPEDWVLFRDSDGVATAMLRASGAAKIAELYGVVVTEIYPANPDGSFRPEQITREGDAQVKGWRCWFDAMSRFNGRFVKRQEVTIWSDEDWTGRSVDNAGRMTKSASSRVGTLDSDVRRSLMTRIQTMAVRMLCGMSRVPDGDLAAVWSGTKKTVDRCAKGSGYGNAAERRAAKVTGEDVKVARQHLGEEILRRVGGEKDAARQLLIEITASADGKFKGLSSIDQVTEQWQVDKAKEKLAAHPIFGDKHNE